jgi:surface polysaccharide O-acyltransferase-like enzyme
MIVNNLCFYLLYLFYGFLLCRQSMDTKDQFSRGGLFFVSRFLIRLRDCWVIPR